MLVVFFFICLGSSFPVTSYVTGPEDAVLIATFSSNGIEGEIEFFKEYQVHNSSGGLQTVARTFIQKPASEFFTWRVHQFPPDQLHDDPCSKDILGSKVVELTDGQGRLQGGHARLFSLGDLKLSEEGGIAGRALILENRNRKACALIRPSAKNKVYFAKFYSPIGGTITITQSDFSATISSNLFRTDGSRNSTSNPWSIVEFSRKDDLEKNFKKEMSKCRLLRKTKMAKLSDFIGNISIGQSGRSGCRSHFVDPYLDSLDDKNGTLYIIVYSDVDPSSIVACGMVHKAEKKVLQADFNSWQQISGYVRLEQDTPLEPTVIMAGIDRLDRQAVRYGIDRLPSFKASRGQCSTLQGQAKFYNPMEVQDGDDVDEYDNLPTIDERTRETQDRYPVGDISAKHGTLLYRDSIDKLFIDNRIYLNGPMSVEGRSVVIYDDEKRPIACANLKRQNIKMVTAVASFEGQIRGQIIFRQPEDNVKSETTIYVILYHTDKTFNGTTEHYWRIHSGSVNVSLGKSSENCSQANGVFNPYKVDTENKYSCECKRENPMRCAIGDLSAKLQSLKLTGLGEASNPDRPGRYVFTDPNLPLYGPNSIIGRAVVVYGNQNEERPMICTNIVKISEENFLDATGF